MANPITGEIVLRKVWDEAEEALKVTMAGTQFQVALNQADGDSITNHPNSSVISDTSEISAVGMKSACLYIEADGTGTDQAKLQVSPIDSGDVWIDIPTSTVTANATDLVMGSIHNICARRIRIVNITGTPTVHIVIQAV